LFGFLEFREYLRLRLDEAGRGAVTLWAGKIQVHPSLISQVLAGTRSLTPEQAFDLAEHLELSPLEAEYFQKLVAHDRAGSVKLRAHLQRELEALRAKALNLSERFEHDKKLSETEKARFYSHRLYSAIRLYCSTNPEGRTLGEICSAFRLERARAQEIIEFLQGADLIIEMQGRFQIGLQRTFLPKTSPFFFFFYANWRLGALTRVPRLSDQELMFTCPMSISREDFDKLRELIAGLIEKSSKLIADSPAEQVACLNLDLFWVTEED